MERGSVGRGVDDKIRWVGGPAVGGQERPVARRSTVGLDMEGSVGAVRPGHNVTIAELRRSSAREVREMAGSVFCRRLEVRRCFGSCSHQELSLNLAIA